MVWRRVLVPASTTLQEVHGILPVAMGGLKASFCENHNQRASYL
ncbi:plasmid pRiA4b ORF-3 family protein [Aliiroseovarius crassostreae]|nr:plasmid pRiA4b ORF-3 family protein [Aliiroseovarius crassostreae]